MSESNSQKGTKGHAPQRGARVSPPVWMLVALCIALSPSLRAQDAPDYPPVLPGLHRILSADVKAWYLDAVSYIFVADRGLDRILDYLGELPGTKPKLRIYKVGKDPATVPQKLDAFYSSWADEAGYRRIIDVRLGLPPGVEMAPKNAWYRSPSERLPKTWPPEPPHTNLPFPKGGPAWERESYAWITTYYRPGDDGGAFISAWLQGTHIWAFKAGHVPAAPILGELLGMPWVGLEDVIPDEMTPLGSPLPGMPIPAEDAFFVQAHLGRWEIGSLTRDMAARSADATSGDPLALFFSVAPAVFARVRQAWIVVFRGHEPYRHEAAAPYREWVAGIGWPVLFEMEADDIPITAWCQPTPKGGALVLFDVDDTTVALICDGGPDPMSLLPLAALAK